ncbi:glycosyltransferase [Agrococcus jenensis]|uniref:D-inositol 3-phosphate glycosyltransferase n=1 Tax=Agrococcus jenensis TaxID=46353 RepID=A0A3N2ATD2_9MICO|nr:glycosyltransferase [Agrococcus jenensis]ROR66246.1 glycosyltransferase involved in cell wall biosynthesis [Agrococcus jenensis]
MPRPRIAIAHDYLTQRGGAEKVVLALHRAFPEASVHTTLYEPSETYPEFTGVDVRAGTLNRIKLFRKRHRLALPFLPGAAQRIRVDAQHTIVSSSGWAHGFQASGSKIVYCHSPARWLYHADAYLGKSRFGPRAVALALLRAGLKRWDRKQALSATTYFANSTVVQQRIRDAYGIDAEVLPAPHSVDIHAVQEAVDIAPLGQPFYLCISRLLTYKNVDAVVAAFNELRLPLVVVGSGPEQRRIAAMAGPTIVMREALSDAQMRWLYDRCRAVVSASYEDFGLTPIEAASFGKPAVVLRWGGFLDTIKEGETGEYFDAPEPDAIVDAVNRFQSREWDPEAIKEHAALFSEHRFAERLHREIARIDASEADRT